MELHELDDVDVRAYLRGAVHAKILDGWYNYGPSGSVRWIIAPKRPHKSTNIDGQAIREYCWMLEEAGIEPLYVS